MKIVVVGGVAGGASCAARARRLDESAQILMLDRGPYVSFANCGLPYYVGDVIRDESKLLVASAELFRERFNIDVRTRHEVVAIDRARREIRVRDLAAGTEGVESYDALVLSPGASAIRPPWAGIDRPGIFSIRTIPDSRSIRDWIARQPARRAVVVGAGFIGLEMAENLVARGLAVTIVELAPQVMPPLDPEMAQPVQAHLEQHGVQVVLGDGVAGFEAGTQSPLCVVTQSGRRFEADLVILAVGVTPETSLARAAGLELGARGGIRVDDQMRTSDPRILAVGDAVEERDTITGQWMVLPLAGPANRQGRIAAEVICGRPSRFRGVQATAICGLFGLAVASTGASEKALRRAGLANFEAIYLHPGHHVAYFPGAKPIHLKLVFRKPDGRVLGAQAVGEADVDRKIDAIAMAIQKQATVFDLEESELCYAPQFGAAKDPVNMAGMIAANHLRGDLPLAHWTDLNARPGLLVDVRDPDEYAAGHISGAVNWPLSQLRRQLSDLPREREIWLYCGVGQRSYYATRLLSQLGFRVRNLPGGMRTYRWFERLAG
jgi:NADPH-dependent 2,4-dienoyl-CoA reductase/sulfur reductase-like enzyme/rhodanese-related sulfurtransferase